jgi:gamma-glutamyltranspeptidase/glutathione hydrolase
LLRLALLLLALPLAAGAQLRPSQSQPQLPEARAERVATAKQYMVAAAHPLGVEAGLGILAKGGNAIDAMVATQAALMVVEPQSSGFGGGAFLLYYDARSGKVRAYDGRETAPAGAGPDLFLGADGRPMDILDALVGGRAVGVPGTARLLEAAHARHGRLPWAALFAPAIALAEQGFPLSRHLAGLLERDKNLIGNAAARAYFYAPDGKPKPAGTILRNPALAATLRLVAAQGADAIYTGEIAKDIEAAVRSHPKNPGSLSREDLALYRVRMVEPLCGNYRAWRLCGMPPSSSGGIAVLQMLSFLSHFDLGSMRPASAEAVHLFSEAGRLAFADRNRYLGDDRFVDVPLEGLLDPAYLAGRAALVDAKKSMGVASAGTPPGVKVALADSSPGVEAGTTHFSIVDGEGNAVAMTSTIERYLGSRLMVRGFLLNNELTDFDFVPLDGGRLVANAVAPGKRPRSSMSPFLVFGAASGRLEEIIGSQGGSFIIGHVAKVLVATLDWKLDMQSAISLPNFGSRNGPTEIEKGTELENGEGDLKSMGHDVRAIPMPSGLHGIRRTAAGWEGGADPRGHGVARGR